MNTNEKVKYCMHCGEQVAVGAKFCSNCGGKLEQNFGKSDWYQPNQEEYTAEQAGMGERVAGWFEKNFSAAKDFLEQTDYMPDEDAEALFIDKKIEHYSGCFSEMRKLNKKVKLNWAALFFGVLWMLYRKMYAVAVVTFVVELVIAMTGTLSGILGLGLAVCCGLFGNYLYMMTVQQRVTEMKTLADPALTMYVEKYKGVNKSAVLIGVVILAIIMLPLLMLFGLSFTALLFA